MPRIIVTILATVAVLAATAVSATGQEPGKFPQLAPCQPGQFPTPEYPCMIPPCAAGQQPTPEMPCMRQMPGGPGSPPGPGQYPGPMPPAGGPGQYPGGPGQYPGGPGQYPGGPGQHPGGPGQMPDAEHGGPGPEMDQDFLNRAWRFDAEANSYDAASNTLNVTVLKVNNLPKRMIEAAEEIVDQDAYVLFGAGTRVYDAAGKRVPKEARYDALLDRAETVLVTGKMMPPQKWQKDEDDMPVPTIRVKRVKITG